MFTNLQVTYIISYLFLYTCMLVFSIQKNVFVETIFQEKLRLSNLTVTWIAVETSLKSAEAETELMFTTLQVPRNYYISN